MINWIRLKLLKSNKIRCPIYLLHISFISLMCLLILTNIQHFLNFKQELLMKMGKNAKMPESDIMNDICV